MTITRGISKKPLKGHSSRSSFPLSSLGSAYQPTIRTVPMNSPKSIVYTPKLVSAPYNSSVSNTMTPDRSTCERGADFPQAEEGLQRQMEEPPAAFESIICNESLNPEYEIEEAEVEVASCHDIGRSVLNVSRDVDSSVAFHDIIQAVYVPEIIDAKQIADSAVATMGSEQAIWTTILGLTTKVIQQDQMIQSLINRVISCDKSNRATVRTTQLFDLFRCDFASQCPDFLSNETPHFLKDIDIKSLALSIKRNLQYPQALRLSGHITGRGYWKYFVQGLFYKLLKDKENISKLTYRITGGRHESDGKVNVCSSVNWPLTTKITEMIVHMMGKFQTDEKAEYMNHAATTIQESLVDVRRSVDASRKKRPGTKGKEINFFEELTRDN